MSYRTVVDKILRRLREDTLGSDWTGVLDDASEADDYQKLIGDFVNEAKVMIEDAWQWSVLRTIESVTTVASTATYTLSGLDSRSRILQVFDETNDIMLKQISDAQFYHYTYVGATQEGQPTYYRLKDNTMSFWPTPDAAFSIKVHAVQPQDDRTLAADTFKVQEALVVLGAYSLALSERGEDGGTGTDVAAGRFKDSLADAITQDETRTINETTWYAS